MGHSRSAKDSATRADIYETVTNQIIAAIEAGAPAFTMPWHRSQGQIWRPVNIATGARYAGINIVTLWVSAETRGYASPVWGTFKQWLDNETPVREGEKASPGIVYKEFPTEVTDPASGETTQQTGRMAKGFWLFNAAQVEGYAPPDVEEVVPASIDAVATADSLITASGARISHGGDRAYYRPSTDEIVLPDPIRFIGTATMTPTEAYYATALHELVHWTSPKHRLDRDLAARFADNAYCMEELVAELGAAFLCVDLGVTPVARPDHAAYVDHWLNVFRGDRKAIFTAAAHAQRAAAYLAAFGPSPGPARPASSDDGVELADPEPQP